MTIATFMVVGGVATAVGAAGGTLTVPTAYFGSDTLGNVTDQSIIQDPHMATGQEAHYLQGGSGAGQGAMAAASIAAALQQTAPMSKMLTSGACTAFGGTAGSATHNANGVCIGLDAVDIYTALGVQTGAGATNCSDPTLANQNTPTPGSGLQYSGSALAFKNGVANQNWKWTLALLYGGYDLSDPTTLPDCNSTLRRSLVNNWSTLFQNASCTSSTTANAGTVCGDSIHLAAGDTVHVPLWHAFRRDDASGTSDVFSSLIGLQTLMPSPSASSNNGFGASPYCNALNWDTSTANIPTSSSACGGAHNGSGVPTVGLHDQFVGPGGVPDPSSQCVFSNFTSTGLGAESCPLMFTQCTVGTNCNGNHRMPPAGVWGANPASSGNPAAWDVLPTSFQDNDPVRRTCIGTNTGGQAGNPRRSGEEVCNLDGNLGVVLAIPSSDFIVAQGLTQYPSNACSGAQLLGNAINVLSCAPTKTTNHGGECENGDAFTGTGCLVPIDTVSNTSQCLSSLSTSVVGPTVIPGLSWDGRVYNLFMRDGDVRTDGSITFISQTIQNGKATPPHVDFAGGMARIHTVQTVWNDGQVPSNAAAKLLSPPNVGCEEVDATDQIACLTAADPCSVGYAGDGGKTWWARQNGTVCQYLADLSVPLCTGTGANNDQPPYSGTKCPANCLGSSLAGPQSAESARIDQVYPTQSSVQALGQAQAEYQVARKLYFNSIVGFNAITAPNLTGDPATGELDLGEFMAGISTTTMNPNINPILDLVGYFHLTGQPTLGNSASGTPFATFNKPFCEDFNEQMICNPAVGTGGVTTNVNACPGNSSIPSSIWSGTGPGIPTAGSICGDGFQDPYEECDNGTKSVTSGVGTAVLGTSVNLGTAPVAGNGATANACSNICRCAGQYSYEQISAGPPAVFGCVPHP